ncbi:hypothetical protein DAERI_070103 [Deinococcus aerius]|uniref:Ricin B lectin domain-containing protein n=1 Tax=Deinococcus aerius TaxID=200253 RepID=A0A2I9DYU9_9DEIO|nr:RICIN domain-containing protein [Deinococcus aerius]GBF06105.1 hypothetical protein DAERI_070103 [Deinococcus aerius]
MHHPLKTAGVIALTSLGLSLPVRAAAQETLQAGAMIVSSVSGAGGSLCLFVPNTRDRTPVEARPCPFNSGGRPELGFLWQVRRDPAGGVTVLSLASDVRAADGRRMEVADWSTASHAAIQIWGANLFDSSNQRWNLVPGPGGGVSLVSVRSGLCLDLPLSYGSPRVNGPVQQFPCHGGDNQRWSFLPVISDR